MCSANVIIMLTIAAWTMGAASMAHAQQNAGDIIEGKADYGSHCAACHGKRSRRRPVCAFFERAHSKPNKACRTEWRCIPIFPGL